MKTLNLSTLPQGAGGGVRRVSAQALAGVAIPDCDAARTSGSQPDMFALQQTVPQKTNIDFRPRFSLLIAMAKRFSTNGCL